MNMIKNSLLRVLAVLFLASGLGSLAACNTVDGMGKDMQAGGREVREEANEHRRR